jgi:hypothetical protein
VLLISYQILYLAKYVVRKGGGWNWLRIMCNGRVWYQWFCCCEISKFCLVFNQLISSFINLVRNTANCMKYEREATKQRRHVITMAVAATRRNLTYVTASPVHRGVINSHGTQQTAHLVLLQATHVQCCCIIMSLHIYVSYESMFSSALQHSYGIYGHQ